jgi:hypothetical protein
LLGLFAANIADDDDYDDDDDDDDDGDGGGGDGGDFDNAAIHVCLTERLKEIERFYTATPEKRPHPPHI